MHIRFIKDYKCYTKGVVVKINDEFAKRFIDGGFAEQISKSYRLGDIYVAPIIQPTKGGFMHSSGEIKHIGFFTKEFKYFSKKPVYTHILTCKDYETNALMEYGFTKKLVVDETKDKEFCEYFFDELMQKGWSESVRLSLEDIREIENKINRNINRNVDDENKRV